jgi:hypothetical protein
VHPMQVVSSREVDEIDLQRNQRELAVDLHPMRVASSRELAASICGPLLVRSKPHAAAKRNLVALVPGLGSAEHPETARGTN